MNIKYPAKINPTKEGYEVKFLDLENCFTYGETQEEAEFNAAEALSGVLEVMIDEGFNIPSASKIKGKYVYEIAPTPDIQVAILMHQIMQSNETTIAQLATATNSSWAATQRLVKAGNNPTLNKLTQAAASLGKRLVVSFE